MPVFIDEHRKMEGLTAEAVIDAHRRDLAVQDRHGVRYLNYWFNADDGSVYCHFAAPNMEAGEAVHREAHGLTADKITEVTQGG